MTGLVVLDSGPLGLAVHPRPPAEFASWLDATMRGALAIGVPEICHYELRRELLRIRAAGSLTQLDDLAAAVPLLGVDSAVLRRGAELWATSRNQGRPTTQPERLDIDVILAATVQLARDAGVDAIVATTNVGHLTRFVPAYHWRDIDPSRGV